jgi:predicted acylesterase/phospholipase RssA
MAVTDQDRAIATGLMIFVNAVRASMAIPFFFEPDRFRAPAGTIGRQEFPSGPVVWVDQQRPPWTIFVDSTGMTATDFGLTGDQQQTLFNNGQSAAKTANRRLRHGWPARKSPSHENGVCRRPLAPALALFEIAAV